MDYTTLTPEDIKLIKGQLKGRKHFGLIDVLLRGKYPIHTDAAVAEMKKAHPKADMVELVKIISAVNVNLKKVSVIMRRDVRTGVIWFAKHEMQLEFRW